MTPFPEDLHEKNSGARKECCCVVRQYESLRWHYPNQVCGSKRMLTLSRAAPRVCSLHDRTKPPACQGRNVKSSPLCGTGTLHGCGFRLYTRCVKQKRELVSAKILNVTGERDEQFQTHRVPPAAARAFSHLLLYFGCNRASGMIQLKCRVATAFTQGRLWILHGGKEYSCAALRRAHVGDYINRRKK